MDYTPEYASSPLRGVEVGRPWDLLEVIRRYAHSDHILVDVGSGPAKKIIPLAEDVAQIYGIEPNTGVRAAGMVNIEQAGLSNVVILDGMDERIPLPDDFADIVTCMIAPSDAYEMRRILKPGGYAILEKLGERDKWNIVTAFGDDEYGPRAQIGVLQKGQRQRRYEEEFGELFSEVTVQDGLWTTYYTREGLEMIFEQVPMIRDFDRVRDAAILDSIEEQFSTPEGIETKQHRVLVIAKK